MAMGLNTFSTSDGFWWFLSASLTLLACSCWYLQAHWIRSALHRFPPGPTPLPLIGSLHLLGSFPHHSFACLAKTFGPILSLRLGSVEVVLVSSSSLAREILSTQCSFFASRPRLEAGSLFYDHRNIAFTPYGPRWKFMRRVYTSNLFTLKKLESFRHIREEEMSHVLRSISTASKHGKPVDLRSFVSTLATNTMLRLVLSERFSGDGKDKRCEVRRMLEEAFRLSEVPVMSDFIPYIRWLDVKGVIKRMRTVSKALDRFLEEVVRERRSWRKENPITEGEGDFLDVLLSISDSESGEKISHEDVKATLLEVLGAGTHTSYLTIERGMAELIRNPCVMSTLEEEIQSHVPTSREVELSDLPSLHYLEAVVKETFRLHPVVPLLLPRVTVQPCSLAGYRIPEKTMVYINVWAIGRDEAYWERPHDFWPERFIGCSRDVKGKDYELLPFGGGRRICPGLQLGLSTVQFAIASLVHSFKWSLVGSCEGTPNKLDKREGMDIVVHSEKPLTLQARERDSGLQRDTRGGHAELDRVA